MRKRIGVIIINCKCSFNLLQDRGRRGTSRDNVRAVRVVRRRKSQQAMKLNCPYRNKVRNKLEEPYDLSSSGSRSGWCRPGILLLWMRCTVIVMVSPQRLLKLLDSTTTIQSTSILLPPFKRDSFWLGVTIEIEGKNHSEFWMARRQCPGESQLSLARMATKKSFNCTKL